MFARLFAAWILKPNYTYVRRAIDIGQANRHLVLAQLSCFLRNEAQGAFELAALGEFRMVLKYNRQWL